MNFWIRNHIGREQEESFSKGSVNWEKWLSIGVKLKTQLKTGMIPWEKEKERNIRQIENW